MGAVCIIVGGLSLFGGCLSFSGMSEIEQLHTAVPFGDGEMSEEVMEMLKNTAPASWVSSIASIASIVFSVLLIVFGMSLLLRNPASVSRLQWWAILYTLFTIGSAAMQWYPRLAILKENSTVEALFLAQITISLPLYLVLPIFLLVYLNTTRVKNELALWR